MKEESGEEKGEERGEKRRVEASREERGEGGEGVWEGTDGSP